MNRTTNEQRFDHYSYYYNQLPSGESMLAYFRAAVQHLQMNSNHQSIFGSFNVLSLGNANPIRSNQLALASRNHQTGLALITATNREPPHNEEGLALVAFDNPRGLRNLYLLVPQRLRVVTCDLIPTRRSLSFDQIMVRIIGQPAMDMINSSFRVMWPNPQPLSGRTLQITQDKAPALFPRLQHYFPLVHSGVESFLHLTGLRSKHTPSVKPIEKPKELKPVKKILPPSMPKILAPHAIKKTFWQSVRAFFITFGNSFVAFFKWLFGKKNNAAIKHYSPATDIAPKTIAEILEAKGFPIDPWQKDRVAFIIYGLGVEWYQALQLAPISRNCGKETQCVHPLTFLWFVLTTKEHKIGSNLPPGQSKNLLEGQGHNVQIDKCIRDLYKKREGIIDAGSLMWKSFLYGENSSGGIVDKIQDSDITPLLDKFAREIDVDPDQIKGLTGSAKEIENVITLLFGRVAGDVKLDPYPADNN